MKIVFFTGAGISKNSGIPTYRDRDGLWNEYNPDEVSSLHGWNKDPKKVIEFFKLVSENVASCEPNEAHTMIADLEKDHEVVIITQNIDSLHERAGSSKVLHIHGELFKDKVTPQGTRPDVVLFGENLKQWPQACKEVGEADVFIIIGTSLEVSPACDIVEYTTTNHKFFIDPKPKNFPDYTLIPMEAIDGMKFLLTKLLSI